MHWPPDLKLYVCVRACVRACVRLCVCVCLYEDQDQDQDSTFHQLLRDELLQLLLQVDARLPTCPMCNSKVGPEDVPDKTSRLSQRRACGAHQITSAIDNSNTDSSGVSDGGLLVLDTFLCRAKKTSSEVTTRTCDSCDICSWIRSDSIPSGQVLGQGKRF